MKLRPAEKSDLESILLLYSQPCMDDGNTPALSETKRIYNKMKDYPDYQAYVAERI